MTSIMQLTLTSVALLLCLISYPHLASAQNYGDECNSTTVCDNSAGLTCDLVDLTCSCIAPTFMVYNVDLKKCVSLVDDGGNCYVEPVAGVERPCVPNAECIRRTGPGIPDDSPFGYCACATGFVKFADRTCDRPKFTQKYGEFCNASLACNGLAGLNCEIGWDPEEGVCECIDPTEMVYDAPSDSCRSLTNGNNTSCFLNPIGGVEKKCVPNSYCHPNEVGNPMHGTCRCDDTYVSLADRSCGQPILDRKYGSTCNTTHLCDGMGALTCTGNGICACMDTTDMVYDANSDTCRTLTNGQDRSCYMAPIGGVLKDCVPNSYCNPDITGNPMYGKCTCNDEYVALADRSCAMPQFSEEYSAPCNSSHFCIKEKILTCNAQGAARQCGCQAGTGMFYETTTDACVVPAGLEYSCSLVPEDGVLKRCTRNAGCVLRPEVGATNGYCACVEGFGENADNTCELKTYEQGFGQICNTTKSCRPDSSLACNVTAGVCACAYPGDVHNSTAGKCVSPLNGVCFTEPINGEKRECPVNAECIAVKEGQVIGTCECLEGFAPGEGGSCLADSAATTITVVPVLGIALFMLQWAFNSILFN